MKILTQGLTETQQLEAVMKAASVGEARARGMLKGELWDAVVIDGNVLVGPSSREASYSSAGELVALSAHALYGEVGTLENSIATIFVGRPGARRELVER